MIRAVALVLLLAAPAWAVKNSALVEMVNGQLRDPRDLCATLACDGTTDEASAAISRAAAIGRTILIPSGKVIGLGSMFTAPDGAEIICGENAGFLALTKSCQGDSRYNGSFCATSADCLGGGTCTGTAFAPTGGTRYVMVGAAGGTKRVSLIGCTLWTNQLDPNGAYSCSTGTNAGRACKSECTGFPGAVCDTTLDCSGIGFGTCSNLGDCETASPTPGHCTGESLSPSGPGIIDAVDFSTVTTAYLENNRVIDHKRGRSFILKGGAGERLDNTAVVSSFPLGGLATPGTVTYAIEAGARVTGTGRISESTLRGTTHGVLLEGTGAKITGGTVAAVQTGGIGVRAAGPTQRITDVSVTAEDACAQLTSTAPNAYTNVGGLSCTPLDPKGTMGVETVGSGQFNVWGGQFIGVFNPVYQGPGSSNMNVSGGRLPFGCGPKVVLNGAGGRVSDLYDAWDSGSCGYCAGGSAAMTVCDVADDCTGGTCSSGTCSGGARNGLACDCPSSTCTPFSPIMIGSWKTKTQGTAHPEIRSLLAHSDQPNMSLIAFGPPRKVCSGGGKIYETCTASDTTNCPHACQGTALNAGTTCTASTQCTCDSNDDCPGSSCSSGSCLGGTACTGGGTCAAIAHNDVRVSDIQFINNQNGVTGLDLSNLTTDQTCTNCTFDGLEFALGGSSTVGFRCPGTSTVAPGLVVMNSKFNGTVIDKLLNCGPYMAGFSNNGPLDADDEMPVVKTYTNDNGSPLAAYEVVELSNAVANAVVKATAGSRVPIGCVLDAPADDAPAKVAIGGVTTCRATDVSLTKGTRLRVSATTGHLEAAASSDFSRIIAQEDAVDQGSYRTVKVLLASTAGTSLGAAPIMNAAEMSSCSTIANANRVIGSLDTSANPQTGSKKGIITATVTFTDNDAGAEEIGVYLYDNGTSACPTICTDATPSGTALASANAIRQTIGPGGNGSEGSITASWYDASTTAGTAYYCLVATHTDGRSNAVTATKGTMWSMELQ